jgi:two-component system, NarL family, response regulator DevR
MPTSPARSRPAPAPVSAPAVRPRPPLRTPARSRRAEPDDAGDVAAPGVRVLLVDDAPVVRVGLATLLRATPHVRIVGEAGTLAQALAEADRCRPDLVVLELALPDGSGITACREIRRRHPGTRVLIFSRCPAEDVVIAAILAGCAGFLLKRAEPAHVVDAIQAVARGGSLLDPSLLAMVLHWVRRLGEAAAADPLARAGLSEHERRILPLIADGKTNGEIGRALSLSEGTIKGYVSSIFQKLHLTRRAQAAAFVARRLEGE